ncbi:MAG TPA: hypothetical protein VIV40_06445 [Kofleriaceae bacterium]
MATTLLATAAAPIGCGYFLYPERRGNTTNVDGGTLVMDLLWLLPGIIPGVIALVVDFTSGAAYRSGGGRSAVLMSPKGQVAVRLPASTQPMKVEVRLVTDHKVLAKKTAMVGPNIAAQSVALQIGDGVQAHRNEAIYLEVASANGTARFPTALAVTE